MATCSTSLVRRNRARRLAVAGQPSRHRERRVREATPGNETGRMLVAFAPFAFPSGLRRPESAERFAVRALAQLLERPFADLANPLARHAHERADLLERHRLRAFLEPVVEIEDLPLARREILLEYAIDKFAHQLVIGDFLDLRAVDAGEAFAQR